MARHIVRFLVALVMVALAMETASAQTSKGAIAGTVTDATGAVVVGATVTAKNTNGGDVRTTTTGNNGEFRIEAIIPSIYEVTVTQQGFATAKISGVDVRASVITSLNTQLKPSTAVDTVQVEANSSLLQTETAELSHAVQTIEVTELPLATQNPVELALTQPGVVSVSQRDAFTNGVGYSVDGLRPRANNFLIDGFDNNDNGIAGQAIQNQNPEAVKEVVILTNSYPAEFGRGGGSVTNVITAGGTNSWHGALWERYAGSSFDAITSEQASDGVTDVPRVNSNFYGFRLGGPIVKNKFFVFGSGQWNPIRGLEQGAQLTVPTAAGLATLQSIGPNQNVQVLLDSLGGFVADQPTGNPIFIGARPGCPAPCAVEVGEKARQAPQKADAHEYVFRADYIASEKDTLTARWLNSYSSLTPDLFANPFALPGTDTMQSGPSRNLGVYWTHVINNHAVNEARFNVQTLDFGFTLAPSSLANPVSSLPAIGITGFGTTGFGGVTTGFPQNRNHSVYEYQDSVTYSVANHNFKFGADLVHLGIEDGVPFNDRGALAYFGGGDCSAIGLGTCTALANYIDDFSGQGGNASKQFGVQQVNYPLTQMAFYVQDDWKLRSNLTVNLGLRYEYQQQPFNVLPFPAVNEKTAVTDPLTKVVKVDPDKNNFGPRLGIAYTPRFWSGLFGDGKTVIRAGAGVFYDALYSNILNNNASSTPNVTGGTVVAPNTGRGIGNFSQVIPGITPGALNGLDAVSTVVSNLRNPLTYQWNLNIQRELPGNWFATIAYVGTRGERLWLNEQLNPGITQDSVRQNPLRGSILARTNHGDSNYHGLQLNAEHRFSKGLLFQSAYTWSKAIDNGSEIFITSGGSTQLQDLQNFRSDRGPSAFDRRHRVVLTWVYALPGAGNSWLAKTLANGWQFSGSAAFQTGSPETLFLGGFDVNGDASFFNDRPSLGNPAVPINWSAACRNPNGTCNTGAGISFDGGATFFDVNSSFVGTAQDFHYLFITGQNGNIGRNSFYNPGRQDVIMAVQREFKLPMKHLEQQALQLRLEAFNPFNHPNLGGGENNVPSVSGDFLTTTFLDKDVTRVGGRSIRLYVKYNF